LHIAGAARDAPYLLFLRDLLGISIATPAEFSTQKIVMII